MCAALANQGSLVRAASRRPELASSARENAEAVAITDPFRPNGWFDALDGVDAVVHLIGLAHQRPSPGSSDSFYRVNVDITQALSTAAVEAAVGHIIYLSSVKAVGEGSSIPYTEETPAQPEDEYGRTKHAAEKALRETAASEDVAVTILRPPLVYGAGVGGNFLRMVHAVDRGVPLPLGLAHVRRSVLYVRNLTDAVQKSLEAGSSANGTFFVSDATAPTVAGLLQRLGAMLGRPTRLLPVPLALLRSAGRLSRHGTEVRRLTTPLLVDASRFERSMQWQQPYALDDGLRATIAWYRQIRHG